MNIDPDHHFSNPDWWVQSVETSFAQAVATSAVFNDAQLAGARLSDMDLSGAQLTGASLMFADLSGSNYDKANMKDTKWMGDLRPEAAKSVAAKTDDNNAIHCSEITMWVSKPDEVAPP